MAGSYQIRWVSKARRDQLKRKPGQHDMVLLDSINGFLIVEPQGSNLGDGEMLTREQADFELREVWCPERKVKLNRARQLLGLPLEQEHPAGMA